MGGDTAYFLSLVGTFDTLDTPIGGVREEEDHHQVRISNFSSPSMLFESGTLSY